MIVANAKKNPRLRATYNDTFHTIIGRSNLEHSSNKIGHLIRCALQLILGIYKLKYRDNSTFRFRYR